MARRPRPKIHGGTYHVMNRGNRKAVIFEDARDRMRFVRLLAESLEEHQVQLLGGTQMGTHFHLVVETPHANVSQFMQQLEGRYADYVNWRYHRVGHLFQGPFKSVLIENDIHLFIAIAYVFANPLVGRLCERLEDWRWSTYAATIGLKPVPAYLSTSWLRTLFSADSFADSQQLFRNCMESSNPVESYLLAEDPTTFNAVRSYISERLQALDQPCNYRELMRPPLEQLFLDSLPTEQRNSTIWAAKVVHGYTLVEIARVIELTPGTVSKIFSKHRRSKATNHVDAIRSA